MPDFPGKDEWIINGEMERVRDVLRDLIIVLLVLTVSLND